MVLNDELSLFTENDSNGNPYWILSGNNRYWRHIV